MKGLVMRDERESSRGFSRRDFLRGSGAAVAAAGTLTATRPEHALAQEPAEALGPGPVKVALSVNGKDVSADIEPRVTLLDALRDYVDVTGCKRVCDRGTCGACTVLLDGKPVYACSMLALDAVDKKVTTVEGLLGAGDQLADQLTSVQKAFWEKDASQCGFCTPGFVVACAAVLKSNPQATAAEITHGLDGNICRCGTYEQMAQAIGELTGGRS